MEEMKKQVEQLQKKVSYLRLTIFLIIGAIFSTQFALYRSHLAIRAYYQESLHHSQNLSETYDRAINFLDEVNQLLDVIDHLLVEDCQNPLKDTE